jgi:hypothetical protein
MNSLQIFQETRLGNLIRLTVNSQLFRASKFKMSAVASENGAAAW